MKVRSEALPLLLLAVAAALFTLITSALILAWPAAAQGNDPTDLAPANLTAAVADGALTLTWEAPDVDAGSVTGYRILRRRPLQGETTLEVLLDDTGTPATAYADYSATEGGVRYVYRVVALRGDEASAHSNFVAFSLSDDLTNVGPARAPSNLAAAVEKGALTLRWDAPAQQAGSVTGYQVLRRRPLAGEKDLFLVDRDTGGDATSWVDYDATEGGARYVYRVRALRDGAVSHHSNFTVITLEQDLDPQPPRDSEKQESDPPIVPLLAGTPTSVSLKTTGRTSATATVELVASHDEAVYVQYRPTGATTWGTTLSGTPASAGASVDLDLTDLEPNVTYNVRASHEEDFQVSELARTIFTNRPADEDYDSLNPDNDHPSGIWGTADTLYVGQYSSSADGKIMEYDRSDKSFASTTTLSDIAGLANTTETPEGLWSDGTHLWMVVRSGAAEAILLADKTHVPGQKINTAASSQTYGIWGNDSTIWIADSSGVILYAHAKATKAADTTKNISLDTDNTSARGIWSDGATMWVLDRADSNAYAYAISSKARDADKDFDLDPANTRPRGIWSDGDTVWVSDQTGAKLYAYYLPLTVAPGPTAVSAKSTGRNTATATVEVTAATDATVYLRHAPSGTTDWSATLSGSPPSAGAPVDIDLTGLTPNATYDLEASLDMTFTDGTEIGGAFTNRPAGEDYNSLNEDNDYPSGIWGTADTLYVGQYNESSGALGKIMEYDRPDQSHASTTTLSDITGLGSETNLPVGLWSDGTHLWMVSVNGYVEAILLSDNTHVSGQSINTAASSGTYGIWGNDSTIWIADNQGDILRAHAKATRAADTTKNISPDADNEDSRGIWSDGDTIWVIDTDDDRAYAYVLSAGTTFGDRDKEQEFDLDPANTRPRGIWSDGDTVWVSDQTGGKLYAYYLPLAAPGPTAVSAKSTGRNTATATVEVNNPDSAMLAVNLRHRLTTETNWTNATAQATTGISAAFDLTGLTPNAKYVLEASLDSTFTDGTEVGGAFTNRPVDRDFGTLSADNDELTGIWMNDDYLYAADGAGNQARVFTYERADLSAFTSIVVNDLGLGDFYIGGKFSDLWSDGDLLWMVEENGNVPAASVAESPGELVRNSRSDRNHFLSGISGNTTNTWGIWGNSNTIWVAENDIDFNLLAFDKFSKAPKTSRNIGLDVSNAKPRGIWSDGSTVWVVDQQSGMAYAYRIALGSTFGDRDAGRDLSLVDHSAGGAWGIWSDGDTAWVSDNGDSAIYAYYLPGGDDTRPTGVGLTDFTRTTAAATVTLHNPRSEGTSVYLRYKPTTAGNMAWVTAVAQHGVTGTSASFSLSGLTAGVHYDVQAALDGNFGTHVAADTFMVRPTHRDFDRPTLAAAGNDELVNLWSNGATMWVGDEADAKFYAYHLDDGLRDTGNEISKTDLSGLFDTTTTVGAGLWGTATSCGSRQQKASKPFMSRVPKLSLPRPCTLLQTML